MRFTGYKRYILLFFAKIVSIINVIIPKNKNQILFFTNIDNFNDNNRALFEFLINNGYNEKYKIFYATPSAVEFVKNKKNVYFIKIKSGLFEFLFSKYVFYDGGTTKIKPTKNQMVVSLWHGTPLKKIGTGVEKTTKNDRIDDFSFIITTSKNLIKIFSNSFNISEKYVKIFGYPRNDYLFTPNKDLLKLYQEREYKFNIIWMPTFRKNIRENTIVENGDFGIAFLRESNDFNELNKFLKEKDIFFTIKLHPLSIQNYLQYPTFSNIKIINNEFYSNLNIQNYSFVGNFDALITDYSSVYFDYLLLDRPIGFIIDDFNKYKNDRGFTFENPLEMMPGEIMQTKNELFNFLDNFANNTDNFQNKRLEIKNFIHTKTQKDSACVDMLDYVGITKN